MSAFQSTMTRTMGTRPELSCARGQPPGGPSAGCQALDAWILRALPAQAWTERRLTHSGAASITMLQ
jgi:hypothetical protein